MYDEEDEVFYILTNYFDEKLGLFVIRFQVQNPKLYTFLIKWKNKLNIGDINIHILKNLNPETNEQTKEVVISFKTININTYNLLVMDISNDTVNKTEKKTIIFRHESFQLWESKITGILLNKTMDFVTFNRDGMNLLALGSKDKRALVDNRGNNRMIHSLESCNYLKVDKTNYILFSCANYNDRQIQIQQEYSLKTKQKDNS